jgi:hypothetical protein
MRLWSSSESYNKQSNWKHAGIRTCHELWGAAHDRSEIMLSGLNQGLKETTTAGRKREGSSAIFLSNHRTNSFALDNIYTPLTET